MSSLQGPRLARAVTIFFAVVILVPCLVGFAAKFIEFVNTFRGRSDGAFAITPLVNYLLASLGFLCLLLWAVRNGMFHDIEKPKYTMLDDEKLLNRSAKKGK